MRKGLLGAIVGFSMMIAQSAGAADMIRYDKSASKVQPEQTVAQVARPCATCPRQCPPKQATCPRQCPPRHHHHKKHHHKHHGHHHKHSVKKQQGANHQKGHNDRMEEKKMSSEKGRSTARKTSSQRNNKTNTVEEYTDEVGREHR